MRRLYNIELPPECVKLLRKYLVVLNDKARQHGSKKITMSPLVSAILIKHLLDHEDWIRKRFIDVCSQQLEGGLSELLEPVWGTTVEVPDAGRASQ